MNFENKLETLFAMFLSRRTLSGIQRSVQHCSLKKTNYSLVNISVFFFFLVIQILVIKIEFVCDKYGDRL